jgi:uncharacterized cupredoxin-like copper-binding protein
MRSHAEEVFMRLAGIAVLAAGAVLLGACASAPRPQEITLTALTMTYTPSLLEVTAGVPIELTLINQDSLEHDFSILQIPVESVSAADPMSAEHQMQMGETALEPVLHVAAEPGATNRLSFTPTKPDRYEFYCTVPGHKEAGMAGTLVVNAP